MGRGRGCGRSAGPCRLHGGRARGHGRSGPSLRVSNERRLRSRGPSWANRIGVSRCLEGRRAPDEFPSRTPHWTEDSGRSGPGAWAALTGSASARGPELRAQAAAPGWSKAKVGDAWLGRAASARTRLGTGGRIRKEADTADCGGLGSLNAEKTEPPGT